MYKNACHKIFEKKICFLCIFMCPSICKQNISIQAINLICGYLFPFAPSKN